MLRIMKWLKQLYQSTILCDATKICWEFVIMENGFSAKIYGKMRIIASLQIQQTSKKNANINEVDLCSG